MTTDTDTDTGAAGDADDVSMGEEGWEDDVVSDEDLHGFVDAYVAPWAADRQRAGTGIWCPRWYDHPDVVLRLAELAGSRAALFDTDDDVDRVVVGRWWVDLLDRHIAAICAVDGPLRRCRHGHRDTAETTPLRFESVNDWFTGWFSLIWTRRPVDLWWCDQWDRHPEVLLQLIELWMLWETARHQPGAMLGWWEQAHRTMAHVTADTGPMAACKTGRSHHTQWVALDGQPIDPGPPTDSSGR